MKPAPITKTNIVGAPIFKAESISNITVLESTGTSSPTEGRCVVTFANGNGAAVAHIDMTFSASADFAGLVEKLASWRASADSFLTAPKAH